MARNRIMMVPVITGLALCMAVLFPINAHRAYAEGQKAGTSPEKAEPAMAAAWGIRPLYVMLSADGYMLDFRYRVIDADKAAPLFGPKIKPYIIDQASGAVMAVPNVPKIGALRSTRKPLKDKNYAILFANPQKFIRPGSKVTVVIGDLRLEDLVVQQ